MSNDLRNRSLDLIERAGFAISQREAQNLVVLDFGLGNQPREGAQYIDIVLTGRLRISVLVLLPNQTLPQHCHPPYDGTPGKEENVRSLFGEMRVYLPGNDMRKGFIVKGKEQFYTARSESILLPGNSLTIEPGIEHWFQAGPHGSVSLGFYTRADESQNKFTDPAVSTVCGVMLTSRTAKA